MDEEDESFDQSAPPTFDVVAGCPDEFPTLQSCAVDAIVHNQTGVEMQRNKFIRTPSNNDDKNDKNDGNAENDQKAL